MVEGHNSGGGGAGAVIHLDFGDSPVPGATHPVSIGGGGAAGNSPNKASKGSTTTFGTNPSNYYIHQRWWIWWGMERQQRKRWRWWIWWRR